MRCCVIENSAPAKPAEEPCLARVPRELWERDLVVADFADMPNMGIFKLMCRSHQNPSEGALQIPCARYHAAVSTGTARNRCIGARTRLREGFPDYRENPHLRTYYRDIIAIRT